MKSLLCRSTEVKAVWIFTPLFGDVLNLPDDEGKPLEVVSISPSLAGKVHAYLSESKKKLLPWNPVTHYKKGQGVTYKEKPRFAKGNIVGISPNDDMYWSDEPPEDLE